MTLFRVLAARDISQPSYQPVKGHANGRIMDLADDAEPSEDSTQRALKLVLSPLDRPDDVVLAFELVALPFSSMQLQQNPFLEIDLTTTEQVQTVEAKVLLLRPQNTRLSCNGNSTTTIADDDRPMVREHDGHSINGNDCEIIAMSPVHNVNRAESRHPAASHLPNNVSVTHPLSNHALPYDLDLHLSDIPFDDFPDLDVTIID